MPHFNRKLNFICLLTICVSTPDQETFVRAEQGGTIATLPAIVEFHDGRTLATHIDPTTNQSYLRITSTRPNCQLTSSFPWKRIRAIRTAQRQFTPDEFLTWWLLQELKAGEPTAQRQVRPNATPKARPLPQQRISEPQTLHITTTVLSWDDDADLDGVEVLLQPLDDRGHLVVGQGTVEFELHAIDLAEVVWSRQPKVLDRWTVSLKDAALTDIGYVVRLPWRHTKPAELRDYFPWARMSARMRVRGKRLGAVDDQLLLQPFSPYRDWLEDRQPR